MSSRCPRIFRLRVFFHSAFDDLLTVRNIYRNTLGNESKRIITISNYERADDGTDECRFGSEDSINRTASGVSELAVRIVESK